MRVVTSQRITTPFNAAAVASALRDIETQVNNLTEGKVQAVTNATTAAPTGTTQPYQVGDIVRNTATAEVTAGGLSYVILGWVCTVAGTPGTWEEIRTLTADPSGITSVNVADAAADTTTWVVLAGTQTGAQQMLSDAGLTYNANTNALTATTFIGALNGNADTVTVANEATDTTCFVNFTTDASGSLAPKTNANITFNASTGVVTVAQQFTSSLVTGTAPLSIASTTRVANLNVARSGVADTVTVADAASDTTTWPMVATSQTGDLAPATDAGLTYNANTNQLAVSGTYAVGANQVVSARVTGWGTPSSTLLRTTYATYAGITFANSTYSGLFTDLQTLDDHVKGLSQRLGALITDLVGHGLIGA